MRLWLSGGTGFVGGRLAALLRAEGHDVVALARATSDTRHLRGIGAEIAVGDVTDPSSIAESMAGCDGGFHVAAWYEVGVTDRDRMFRTNVGGTESVLEAARATGVPKLVYCSTAGALGWHAPGELPDETHENPRELGSYYNESKYAAHRVVRAAAADGLPVVQVLPGAVYGPGDPSVIGRVLKLVARGWMRVTGLDDTEFSWVFVDDAARGHLLALERGAPGAEYNLGGDPATVGAFLARAARIAGRRPPRVRVPTGVLRAVAPISGPFARLAGLGPRALTEALGSMAGERSWAYSWDRAAREIGYAPRGLDEGLRETMAALRP